MHVVFGIGNPGPEYERTRHNLGFAVVHAIADEAAARVVPIAGLPAEGARVRLAGTPVLLVKPLTYVNRCGPVLAAIRKRLGVPLERLLVVLDDLNLPLGGLRLRGGGSDGGHNGLRSLQAHLQSTAFPRLRIGIGAPGALPVVDFVLQPFAEVELPEMQAAVARAVDAARVWVAAGLQPAMAAANRRRDLDRGGKRP